ncbi:hypothetical protein M427DRAFT_45298 [Gonapodya prolifera JEL478]|uniref:Uncharacterized protein n=1 Tax=Gonapodya prolifera (strain JEL478) TaxID=1344416 RepID=A0A139AC53_GONPJ|nr:hypothetical protein M427DRAFT_45298 [Gonapodya prolifera JEL478]|eukprot:KXS14003.1 hypothetical protein M427DRAFT_45298 [Gonapodya prolifera JEL478]
MASSLVVPRWRSPLPHAPPAVGVPSVRATHILIKHGNACAYFEVGRRLTGEKIKAVFDNLRGDGQDAPVNFVKRPPGFLLAQMPDGSEKEVRPEGAGEYTLGCFPEETLGSTFLIEREDDGNRLHHTGIMKRQLQMAFALSEAIYEDYPADALTSIGKGEYQNFLNVETVRSDFSTTVRYAVGFPRFDSHQLQGEVYIAIRGSENRDDWLRNLNVAPKVVDPEGAEDADVALRSQSELSGAKPSRQVPASRKNGTAAPITMHRGFADSSKLIPFELIEDIVKARRQQLAKASLPRSGRTYDAWSGSESGESFHDTREDTETAQNGYPDAHTRQIKVGSRQALRIQVISYQASDSAGGSVAHCFHAFWRLANLEAAKQGVVQMASIGFGSPFFGSRGLGEELRKLPGNKDNRMFLTVVNGNDPVPRCLNMLETFGKYQSELANRGVDPWKVAEAAAGFVVPAVAAKIAVDATRFAIQNLDKISSSARDWQVRAQNMYYPVGVYCFLTFDSPGAFVIPDSNVHLSARSEIENEPGAIKKRLGPADLDAEVAHSVENYRKMLVDTGLISRITEDPPEVTPQGILEPFIDPEECTYSVDVSEDKLVYDIKVQIVGENFNYLSGRTTVTTFLLEDYGPTGSSIELRPNPSESGRKFIVVSGSLPKDRIRADPESFCLRVTSIFGGSNSKRWRNGKIALGYIPKGDIKVNLTMADQMRAEFLEPLLTNLVHRSVVEALFSERDDIENSPLFLQLHNLDVVCGTHMAQAAKDVKQRTRAVQRPAKVDQQILEDTVKTAEGEIQKALKLILDSLVISFQYSNVTKAAAATAAVVVVGTTVFMTGGGAALAALAPAWVGAETGAVGASVGVGSVAGGISYAITALSWKNLLQFQKIQKDDEKYRDILKEICIELEGMDTLKTKTLVKADDLEKQIVQALSQVNGPGDIQGTTETVFRKNGRLHQDNTFREVKDESREDWLRRAYMCKVIHGMRLSLLKNIFIVAIGPQHAGKSEVLRTLFPDAGVPETKYGDHTKWVTFYHTALDGCPVTVVDCPGFDGIVDQNDSYNMRNIQDMELMMRHGCLIGSIYLCLIKFGNDLRKEDVIFNAEVMSNPMYARYPKLLMINQVLENGDFMHSLKGSQVPVDDVRRRYSKWLSLPHSMVHLTDLRIGKLIDGRTKKEQETMSERSELALERGVWGENLVKGWIADQITQIHLAAAL